MKVKQLRVLAKKKGIKGYSKMKKAKLEKLVNENLKGGGLFWGLSGILGASKKGEGRKKYNMKE